MKNKQMQYWEAFRKAGKKKYILKYFMGTGAF